MKTLRVQVSLSDPWDLGELLKWQPLVGELLKIDVEDRGGRALIKFDQQIHYKEVLYQFVVAAPRHEGDSLTAVHEGGKVFCSFTGISDEHARSKDALSTEHWRGGLIIIGDLELLAPMTAKK